MTVLLINYQACPCPVLNLAFFKNVRSTRSSYWLLSKRMSSSFQHTPPSHSSHSERPKHPCWQLFHWRVQRGRHARDHNRPRSWPGRLCDAGPRNAPPSPPAATAAKAPGHRPTPASDASRESRPSGRARRGRARCRRAPSTRSWRDVLDAPLTGHVEVADWRDTFRSLLAELVEGFRSFP